MKCPRIENCPMYCECHGDIPDSPSWKSVRDELPQYGQIIIMLVDGINGEKHYPLAGEYNKQHLDMSGIILRYWMPLPPPPDGKE